MIRGKAYIKFTKTPTRPGLVISLDIIFMEVSSLSFSTPCIANLRLIEIDSKCSLISSISE
jgi:hypothetical protein